MLIFIFYFYIYYLLLLALLLLLYRNNEEDILSGFDNNVLISAAWPGGQQCGLRLQNITKSQRVDIHEHDLTSCFIQQWMLAIMILTPYLGASRHGDEDADVDVWLTTGYRIRNTFIREYIYSQYNKYNNKLQSQKGVNILPCLIYCEALMSTISFSPFGYWHRVLLV